MNDTSSRLLTEAFVVGAGLVPVYFITHSFITRLLPGMTDEGQDYLSVFLSGSLFHILCEETGINDWYLDNGVAVLKREQAYQTQGMMADPDLCDGRCGWSGDGLCSHYSLHTGGAW